MVFLDNAATSYHKPPAVYRAVRDAMRECASVGRGGYAEAEAAAARVYDCRTELAALYHVANPEKIIFTYNATVALNMAIKGLLHSGHAVISGYEHNAVVRPLVSLERCGVTYTAAQAPLFDQEGLLQEFRACLRPETGLVVCNHVSNVFGSIAPVEALDALCWEHGLPLVIDASQSAGTLPLDASRLRATEFICMPGHKGLYGPQGTGVMLHTGTRACTTILEGGTGSASASYLQPTFEPDRFESGTLNVAGIAGLCEGVRFVRREGEAQIAGRERRLVRYVGSELQKIDGVTVYMSRDPAAQSGVLSFASRDMECETLAAALSSAGIAVRAGLHCAPLAHVTAGTYPGGTVRVSPGAFSTQRDAERLIIAVRAALRRGSPSAV